jgi:hypothetical protein
MEGSVGFSKTFEEGYVIDNLRKNGERVKGRGCAASIPSHSAQQTRINECTITAVLNTKAGEHEYEKR